MMSQGSSQVGCLSKYKICICQNQMIDKLWLGVGCGENSVLKIETESHQSGAQAFSNYCADLKYNNSGDMNCTAEALYV